MSTRAEPRFTRDLDLAVAVASDREAEELIRFLLGRGWRVLALVEQEATGRLATARLKPPTNRVPEGVVVDLRFASSGIEPDLVREAEPLEVFDGGTVPVASLAHLLALKVLAQEETRRPQDRVDARALLSAARPQDVEQARAALERIRELGFHRGKDLVRELEELLPS